MQLFRETLLLFSLNALDAFLTLIWVRTGAATEGNALMAALLDMGDAPFLAAKLAMGTAAALVLLKWGNLRLARYGVSLALIVYISVMGVHVVTGLSAFGLVSDNFIENINEFSNAVFGFFL